jgi:eukaryotic-like serine/threonine-protein kinase
VAIGRIIAQKYKLLYALGRGGMGSVWVAEHLGLGTQVAVKLS